MGAEYSFEMDNNRLLKGFLRLRNGGLLFLIISMNTIIFGILYLIYFFNGDDAIGIALWFFELINFFMIITAAILIYSSLKIIIRNINGKRERLFNLARSLLLIFIILFSLSTIISLLFHWYNEMPRFSMAKNMIVYIFLTAFLLAFSFCFKDLERIGYGTRLLYVPLIFLTIPSIISLILGAMNFSNNDDIFNFYSSLVNQYMVVLMFFSFLELYLVLQRMTNLIDVHYVFKTPETEPFKKATISTKK